MKHQTIIVHLLNCFAIMGSSFAFSAASVKFEILLRMSIAVGCCSVDISIRVISLEIIW